MANIIYKGKTREVKIGRAFSLRMEELGFPVTADKKQLDARPLGYLCAAVKCALNLEESLDEILEAYENTNELTDIGVEILKEGGQALRPTQAAKPKAAKKR